MEYAEQLVSGEQRSGHPELPALKKSATLDRFDGWEMYGL